LQEQTKEWESELTLKRNLSTLIATLQPKLISNFSLVKQAGVRFEGDHLATLLQAITEGSGINDINDRIEFNPTINAETLLKFIEQMLLEQESLKKIRFGVINVESDNYGLSTSNSNQEASFQTGAVPIAGKDWVSYIQVPNLDKKGNVVSIRAIILNSDQVIMLLLV
jgi:hypothetical protein